MSASPQGFRSTEGWLQIAAYVGWTVAEVVAGLLVLSGRLTLSGREGLELDLPLAGALVALVALAPRSLRRTLLRRTSPGRAVAYMIAILTLVGLAATMASAASQNSTITTDSFPFVAAAISMWVVLALGWLILGDD